MTDSLCCTPETNNIGNQLYSNNFFLEKNVLNVRGRGDKARNRGLVRRIF